MRYFSEFIIFNEDLPMIDAEKLCLLMWKSEYFDNYDSNFYYTFPDKRWSKLTLECFDKDRNVLSFFQLNVCREKPAIASENDLLLSHYLDKKAIYLGNYKIESLAVTSILIDTYEDALYQDFLKTVHTYLLAMNGIVVNHFEKLDAEKFYQNFIIKPSWV